ncbi:Panacea domain-containing protein [Leptospira sarikeiensis]|uniref:DUF4065 domain-containing protein n=1 Tax=Leptospira sarikeiensis TaxID=2484943 RepID=A0A4R9K790_9LEPT|nr:type II toxin-antitoxin system antitoxin SocA domain-containing protein [Leptospira sarikeiensis]TGL61164.1 DUF4065 domain-containing protein [Leptospira sarikeiensis]
MLVSVLDVAKYILSHLNPGQSITTFKLQKLCYYSQAWSLVWDDEPLFEEEILAWANGPVIRELYEEHKGDFVISGLRVGNKSRLTKKQKATVDAVLDAYGKLSGQQLSQLTHQETPWIKARKGLEPGERGARVISLGSMVEYYSAVYSEQQRKKSKKS